MSQAYLGGFQVQIQDVKSTILTEVFGGVHHNLKQMLG
jgi:hypothetical protein